MQSELLVQILHWSKWTKAWVKNTIQQKIFNGSNFHRWSLNHKKLNPWNKLDFMGHNRSVCVHEKSTKIKWSSDWTRPLNMLADVHAYLDVGTVQPWLSEHLWPAPQSKCLDEPKSLDNRVYVRCTVNHAHSHELQSISQTYWITRCFIPITCFTRPWTLF